jgi:hypothetical protein
MMDEIKNACRIYGKTSWKREGKWEDIIGS